MKLELGFTWKQGIPFEKIDKVFTPEHRDVIRVVADISDANADEGFKKRYEGFLSTSEAAENYAAHVILGILGHDNKKDIYTDLVDIGGGYSRFVINNWDRVDNGNRGLVVSSESVAEMQDLRGILMQLERRWYIEPRGEGVNDCDYWEGFFGTSNNLWSGSRYPHASPPEEARQFAYDLEQGLRNKNHKIWFFPGWIDAYPERNFSKKQKGIISEMNKVLKESSRMDTKRIISGLRDCAERYERLR